MKRKASRSMPPTASDITVWAEPQEWVSVLTMAYTRMDRPAVMVSAPGRSRDRWAASRRDSVKASQAPASKAIPMGTLTNNTQRQFNRSVRTPPARTPTAAPLAAVADQAPSARRRSAGSKNRTVRRLNVEGARMAPPTPCAARAAMSQVPL
jgi:hypothetical protein